MLQSMGDSMWRFVANLQSQMPHLHFDDNLFPQLSKFNQQVARDTEEEEDEDDDEELGEAQVFFYIFILLY